MPLDRVQSNAVANRLGLAPSSDETSDVESQVVSVVCCSVSFKIPSQRAQSVETPNAPRMKPGLDCEGSNEQNVQQIIIPIFFMVNPAYRCSRCTPFYLTFNQFLVVFCSSLINSITHLLCLFCGPMKGIN